MRLLAALLTPVLLLPACIGASGDRGRASVVVAIYPLAFVATEVIRGADVTNLSEAGGDPHDLELTPRQIQQIDSADLFIYLGGAFQPAVEDAAEKTEVRKLDVIEALSSVKALREDDPHVWLDPRLLSEIVRLVAEEAARAGLTADSVEEDASALRDRLTDLDREFRLGLTTCRLGVFITSHDSFGYLAAAYGLQSVGVTPTPEDSPTPRRLEEVAQLARDRGLTTIFFEESPRIAETIAAEIGGAVQRIDVLESRPDEGDYFDSMRANLTVLRSALDCR